MTLPKMLSSVDPKSLSPLEIRLVTNLIEIGAALHRLTTKKYKSPSLKYFSFERVIQLATYRATPLQGVRVRHSPATN